ncbi:MAG: hypothetical protein ORN51_00735, partial [Akkermansiaceae bacterium]|nr:hypothetical protein [Akkermansiaceae bacterium]
PANCIATKQKSGFVPSPCPVLNRLCPVLFRPRQDELGELTSRADCKQSRRYLAHSLGNALLNGNGHRAKHQDPTETQALLERLAIAEEQQDDSPENSPHYISVIKPFLSSLSAIKTKGTNDRPPQPGDSELVAISQMP